MKSLHLIIIVTIGVCSLVFSSLFFISIQNNVHDNTQPNVKPLKPHEPKLILQIKYSELDGIRMNPMDITVDPAGNVYLLDEGYSSIHVFDNMGNYLRSFDYVGDDDLPISWYTAKVVDVRGNSYETHANNNSVSVTNSDEDHLFSFGSKGSDEGQFQFPWGIALDSYDNIYIVEHFNNRVQVFTSNGEYLFQFGEYGKANGQFINPTVIAIDNQNQIYVVDSNNGRIQVFESIFS
ncbi:MAG TPA: 6-bladed beta-propeller [Nitrosopumilaceae archaeon]|nr:6-bladed beta-propeller [Nitrosopumilaceae archaeon]